ncbi:MAG: hypothetical protein M1821_007793 [Bathelium mastoideum]|nr:MAG: hypothetical protein M1821_007793 [Bathelium mastoideum]
MLRPGGRDQHRSTSKSRGRDRSRSNVRKAPSPPVAPEPPRVISRHELVSAPGGEEDDDDEEEEEEDDEEDEEEDERHGRVPAHMTMPRMPGGFDGHVTTSPHSARSPVATPGLSNFASSVPYPPDHGQHDHAQSHFPEPFAGHQAYQTEEITMGDYKDLPPHERPHFLAQQQQQQQQYHNGSPHAFGGHSQSPPQPGLSRHFSAPSSQMMPPPPPDPSRHHSQPLQYEEPHAPNQTHPRTSSNAGQGSNSRYANLPQFQYAAVPGKLTYTSKAQTRPPEVPRKVSSPEAQYTMSPSEVPYKMPPPEVPYRMAQPEPTRHRPSMPEHSYSASANANLVEITPGGFGMYEEQEKHGKRTRHASIRDEPRPMKADGHFSPPLPLGHESSGFFEERRPSRLNEATLRPSPDHGPGLTPRMDRLSVSGNRPDMHNIMPGALPPGSPMLEAYHGTYQSISPMPSPMMLPDDHNSDSDLDDFEPLSPHAPLPTPEQFAAGASRPKSGRHRSSSSVSFATSDAAISSSGGTVKSSAAKAAAAKASAAKKRVQLYDAEADAHALISALGHRTADAGPLIDILPRLSHDQVMELRNEYKRRCKVQGRGINIAKHIKLKTSGNFGKFCYVTALGRFESEAYWANFWYQSHGSRRELLIESLMGKTNAEVRLIKESFRDKRYSDSLVRCMDKELKADKFRTAVLLALEEKRQEEADVYSAEQVVRDAEKLHECLKRREGGESAMLQIVVLRSDAHLREVLRAYERRFGENFARAALKKSNNLVGEVIAHILNGVINRPARDALLLHHAIADISSHDKSVELRYELLVSRLVRLHWDRSHLQKVKREYKEKYGRSIEKEIDSVGKGDWGHFAVALLE